MPRRTHAAVLDIDFGWRAAWCLVAVLAGAGLQLRQAALLPVAWYAGGALAGALLFAPVLKWPRAWPLAVLGLALAAFGWTGWRAGERLADSLPPALEGETLQVTGVVANLPQSSADGTRFAFEVEAAEHEGRAVKIPSHLYLGWYRQVQGEDDIDAPRLGLQAGQRWRFAVRLKRPHGAMNPGGGDYELWLFEQGLRATGYVRARPDSPALLLAEDAGHPVERWRQQVRDAIRRQVPDARASGMLAALAVGDQAAIERDDWDIFRASGIAHLVSISGLHVTMMAWLVGAAAGAIWRRVPALALRWPTPQAARWIGLLGAVAYCVVAGWGVPAQRTVLMLAIATGTTAAGVRWPWPLVLLLAAAAVVAWDPWALLQVGFWLSFAAVGLLMASSPAQQEPQASLPASAGLGRRLVAGMKVHLAGTARTQALTTLGLAPLTLVFFQQVSLVGYLANLVAIPLVTLVITPLALAGVLVPPLWTLAAGVVDALVAGLAWLVSWPAAVWTLPPAPVWAAAAGLLAGALLMVPWPRRVRLLALPLALPLLWPVAERPAPGRFELVAADVGQGTSLLVRTATHLLVYDTGPAYGADNDAGQRVLLPLLRYRAEGPIDLLMLSHSDLDHTGGAASLIAHWPVKLLSTSLQPSHPLLQHGVSHRPCSAGQQWTWDGVRFRVLSPQADALRPPPPGAKSTKPNWLSCVLRIEDAEGHAALLMGDAEVPQEARMLADGAALSADIVIVPHHGSRTSSSAAFIDAVHPRLAVVQAAYRSRFGHPAPDVVHRYEERGAQVVRSDRCGAWTWTVDGAHCEREVARRYWQFAQ